VKEDKRGQLLFKLEQTVQMAPYEIYDPEHLVDSHLAFVQLNEKVPVEDQADIVRVAQEVQVRTPLTRCLFAHLSDRFVLLGHGHLIVEH